MHHAAKSDPISGQYLGHSGNTAWIYLRSPYGTLPRHRGDAGLITSAGNKAGPLSSLTRHSIAQPTADIQHRSVQHHHVSGRSMANSVCLLPTPPTLHLANQPVRPHTGRWKCLQRTRRTNQARSPRKGAHSQSTTFKDTPQAKRTNSKDKSGAHEHVAGKVHIYGLLPNNLLSFLI